MAESVEPDKEKFRACFPIRLMAAYTVLSVTRRGDSKSDADERMPGLRVLRTPSPWRMGTKS